MKEQRFFYHPTPLDLELPQEEAAHAMRVLRLQAGDDICLMDGQGTFYEATITEARNHHCRYAISATLPQQPEWHGKIHIAVAPTKNLDRMEWFAEKATEIGFDRLSLLDCRFSERRVVKTDRLERIVVAAMKQSHKAWKPQIDEMQSFEAFVNRPDLPAHRFIAHCYTQSDIDTPSTPSSVPSSTPDDQKILSPSPQHCSERSVRSVPSVPSVPSAPTDLGKPFLRDLLLSPSSPSSSSSDALVLIGPEGDFSIDEVRLAQQHGFTSISLGTSRLRTETAALVAVHLMRLAAE